MSRLRATVNIVNVRIRRSPVKPMLFRASEPETATHSPRLDQLKYSINCAMANIGPHARYCSRHMFGDVASIFDISDVDPICQTHRDKEPEEQWDNPIHERRFDNATVFAS